MKGNVNGKRKVKIKQKGVMVHFALKINVNFTPSNGVRSLFAMLDLDSITQTSFPRTLPLCLCLTLLFKSTSYERNEKFSNVKEMLFFLSKEKGTKKWKYKQNNFFENCDSEYCVVVLTHSTHSGWNHGNPFVYSDIYWNPLCSALHFFFPLLFPFFNCFVLLDRFKSFSKFSFSCHSQFTEFGLVWVFFSYFFLGKVFCTDGKISAFISQNLMWYKAKIKWNIPNKICVNGFALFSIDYKNEKNGNAFTWIRQMRNGNTTFDHTVSKRINSFQISKYSSTRTMCRRHRINCHWTQPPLKLKL